MAKTRIPLNVALFLVVFVICVLVAALILGRGRRSTEPEMLAADTPRAAAPANEAAQTATPVPELMNQGPALPATPVPSLPSGLATPRVRTEADVEPPTAPGNPARTAPNADHTIDKALEAYAIRSARPSPTTEADLPVIAMSEMDRTPAPVIATSRDSVSASNTNQLRELPQGYVVGREGIRPVQKTDITPVATPVDVADFSGGAQDFSTSRVEKILQRYSQDDLPPAIKTPPPIAIPEGIRPRIFTPTPTKSVMERSRNLPTKLIERRLPIVTNMYPETTSPAAGAGPAPTPSLPADPGLMSPMDVVRNFQTRPTIGISPSPVATMSTQAALASSTPLPAVETPLAPAVARAAGTSEAASPAPDTSLSPTPAPATSGSYTVRKGKAEVSFSNVPPGWLKPEASPSPGAAAPAGPPAEPGKASTSGIDSNAGSAPSPTPDLPTGMERPQQGTKNPFNLPPAPTLPPRGSQGETPKSAAVSPVAPRTDNLPPEIAERLGRVSNDAAKVGERILTKQQAARLADAVLVMKGQSADFKDRDIVERVMAEEWAERVAIAEEARRQGLSVTDEEVRDHMEKVKQKTGPKLEEVLKQAGFTEPEILSEMRDSALCEKLVETALNKNFGSDQKLQQVYQQSPEKYEMPRRFHVQEIWKAKPAKAGEARQLERKMEGLRAQVAKGSDFSAVASSESESPSRTQGGDMGWLDSVGEITDTMAEAMLKMRPGDVSNVIESRGGYQILKLVEIEEPKPGFEGARERVKSHLREYLREGCYETAKLHTQVKLGSKVQRSEIKNAPVSSSTRPHAAPRDSRPAPAAPATPAATSPASSPTGSPAPAGGAVPSGFSSSPIQ